jgi:hypothetical protein
MEFMVDGLKNVYKYETRMSDRTREKESGNVR